MIANNVHLMQGTLYVLVPEPLERRGWIESDRVLSKSNRGIRV